MTGAAAAEKEVPGSRADMLHRGRNVALAFTMQVTPSHLTGHAVSLHVRWVSIRPMQNMAGHCADAQHGKVQNVNLPREST